MGGESRVGVAAKLHGASKKLDAADSVTTDPKNTARKSILPYSHASSRIQIPVYTDAKKNSVFASRRSPRCSEGRYA
jgi:hypothetical protein